MSTTTHRRKTPFSLTKYASFAILTIVSLYTLGPLIWLLIASTKNNADLIGTAGFAFADFNLWGNLVELFRADEGIYGRWLLNTALYAVVGAVLSTAISFMAGHAFEKFFFKGKEKLFGFVLLGALLPAAVTAMPLYLISSKLGLVNTFWGVFFPFLVSPFGVYLARVFSRAYVPLEVLEAARIDGASELRAFFSVAMPMMMPAIVTVLLVTFNGIWNNFFLPLLMLSDATLYPVALGIYSWNSLSVSDPSMYHLVIIGSAVTIVPVILVFMMLQRYWKAGLGDGAVK
jgi:multiple sugar transport system permease protein